MGELSQKEKVKLAKDALRPKLRDIRTAEAYLQEQYEKAAPEIRDLIKATGNPGPHKIRLDENTLIVVTFRKTGETLHAGEKIPVYGMKETDLSEDDD